MSKVLRWLAVLLVACALLPRGASRHERLLVVAVDGLRPDYVERLAATGRMPALGALLRDGAFVRLEGGVYGDRELFWREVFAAADEALWRRVENAGGRVVLVHVPGATGPGSAARSVILPGPDPREGFVGGNVGRLVRLERLRAGNLSWPYDVAAARVSEWARTLKPGESSPWIEVVQPEPDGRTGIFRLYLLDGSSGYVSPVYRRALDLETVAPDLGGRTYVAEDPSWTGTGGRTRDYFYLHAREILDGRAAAATALAATRWDLFVYLETLPLAYELVYNDDAGRQELPGATTRAGEPVSADTVPAHVAAIYAELDTRIGGILRAAPERTLLTVIGAAPPVRRAAEGGDSPGAGFVLVGGAGLGPVQARATLAAVEPTLAMLARVPLRSVESGEPVAEILARHGAGRLRRARFATTSQKSVEIPFSVAELATLGVFSDSASAAALPPEEHADGSVELD